MSARPTKGSFPRPSAEAKVAFETLVPDDPRVQVRPMFGNVAAFVNGNMFTGLFGDELFVRLPEGERAGVIAEGGADFEPMPGRAMKAYVSLPPTWRDDLDATRGWVERSLDATGTLPAKTPTKRKARGRKR